MSTGRVDPLLGYSLAGRYQIEEFVAEESLGRVYIARLADNRRVSVKVLHPQLVENHELFARFGREMLATAAVEHPNAVRMIDFGEHRVFHYLVLEYLSGKSLQELILSEGRLHWERAAHIIAQLASALDVAHQENIVHRNLASSTILMLDGVAGDYPKIRDFGMSKLQTGDADAPKLTDAFVRVGDISTMAPEYIENNDVLPQGDLYGLGCLFIEMVSGEPMFKGAKAVVMEAHIDSPPPHPRSFDPEIPDWLEELVLQLLEKDPSKRPARGNDVKARLEAGLGRKLEPPKAGAKPAPAPVEGGPKPKAGGNNAAMAAGAGIVGMGLIGAVGIGLLLVVIVALFLLK